MSKYTSHHLDFSQQLWVGCQAILKSQLVFSMVYCTLWHTESVRRNEKFAGKCCSQIKIKMCA